MLKVNCNIIFKYVALKLHTDFEKNSGKGYKTIFVHISTSIKKLKGVNKKGN